MLIISSWAPPAVGGPQNLYHLFSRFDPDRFGILTSRRNVDAGVQPQGSPLPCPYYFYDDHAFVQTHHPPWVGERASSARRLLRRLSRPFRFAGQFLFALARGLSVVRRHRYELLLGVSGRGLALLMTGCLAALSRRPYALYLFDLYRENNLPLSGRLAARCFEGRLFRRAAGVIVTNEGTAEHYRRRYGSTVKLAVVGNAADRRPYDRLRTPYRPRPPYRLVFTGHIYWAQERSVRNLARAVTAMTETDVQLVLYAPTAPAGLRREFAGHPRVTFTASAQAEMPAVQCGADILVLPLSCHSPSPDIICTATPGKLTDYLVAGRPMLIHAPPDSYLVRYARERGFAHVVDAEDIGALQDGIRKLLTDLPYAGQLVANALETFAENHDADVNARRFADVINQLETIQRRPSP